MKYTITETRKANVIWIYEVEANDEEQALHAVMDGAIEALDYITEEIEDSEVEYNVEETDENN